MTRMFFSKIPGVRMVAKLTIADLIAFIVFSATGPRTEALPLLVSSLLATLGMLILYSE